MTIAEIIKQARQSKGFTKVRLAKEVGVTTQAVVHWENGKTAPKRRHQPIVARVLGIPVQSLGPFNIDGLALIGSTNFVANMPSNDVQDTDDEARDLKMRITALEGAVAGVHRRVDRIEARIDAIERRLAAAEKF